MEPLLSVTDLQKTFPKGVEAVRGVSFSVSRGEVFAFLGPNGAGKSTTVRMICGLCRPTAGMVRVDGLDPRTRRNEYMRRIGLVSQHFNVDDDLTAFENMDVHAKLHGQSGSAVKKRILELLRFAELYDHRDRVARTLSGGMKRKLQIVRSMVHEPEMLFLDEPTAGLDPMSRERIWNLIHQLNVEGKTIFFTTHYIEEAEHYAERVAIIHFGRIIKTGSPQALIQELGPWCRESFFEGQTKREHFRSREEAEAVEANGYSRLTIRPTQLEDVFIRLSGTTFDETEKKPAKQAQAGHGGHGGHG
jgi:ABC-2 type transport system ATP-binding protein